MRFGPSHFHAAYLHLVYGKACTMFNLPEMVKIYT